MPDETEDAALPTAIVTIPARDAVNVADRLAKETRSGYGKYARFIAAVLSGVPWVGSVIGAAGSFTGEAGQERVNDLVKEWLDEHQRRLQDLDAAIRDILGRIESIGEQARARIETEEYLSLVRQGFRAWDDAATAEKRQLVQKLLANAAASGITSDDVVRLFIDWIRQYHEVHFRVIRHVHAHAGATRAEVWRSMSRFEPRENSPEADLFRMVIRDLSTGGVIRQERDTNRNGQFIKKRAKKASSGTMTSAFDDEDGYELTGLGRQFVHYAMSDVVPRFGR